MSTAEELLCSRWWRLKNSLWMLWGILSFGWLACIGWLYVGIRSRNWLQIAVGVGLVAYTVGYWVWLSGLPPQPGKGEPRSDAQHAQANLSALIFVAAWVLSTVGAWFANRKWLVWRARHDKGLAAPWYFTATQGTLPNQPENVARQISVIDAALGQESGTSGNPERGTVDPQESRSQTTVATPGTSTAIDLNRATAEQLTSLPGLDFATALRVIAVRDQLGGFRDTAQLVSQAGVKPHIFAEIRAQVTVISNESPSPHPASSIDNQEPQNGRRLEF